MATYNAPHEVRDQAKLASLMDALRAGKTLPPVIVLDNGETAITGSHRIAAYDALDMEANVIILSAKECQAVLDHAGLDDFSGFVDHENMCRAVYDTTTDADIKSALEDQF